MTEEKKIKNHATLTQLNGKIVFRQKSAFAVQHMMAAARFSRLCGDVEIDHKGEPLGSFFDEQISYVSASVLLATASLESNINEYFSEPTTHFAEVDENILKKMISLLENKSILEKYQVGLVLKGKDKFDQGQPPFQDTDALIKLRNALVHFKPEWHDEQELHRKIESRLKGRFRINPFVGNNGVFFPQQCMSYGCAKWAVETALFFMKSFSDRTGLPYRFEQFEIRVSAKSTKDV